MKHEFALHLDSFSQEPGLQKPGSLVALTDDEVIHRITNILRLQTSEELVLFDRMGHAVVALQEVTKKKIVCLVKSYAHNTVLQPEIVVLLPLLKREAFEEAIYSTVELGASVVQPVITEKTQRSWGGQKEKERVQRIMIAAAEQSKNFSIPELLEPMDFNQAVEKHASELFLFFDPQGQALTKVIQEIQRRQAASIVCLIGPEGDLSEQEKQTLKQNNVISCALTPTVLRASQALVVGLGVLRSV